jgi:phage-related protein
MAEAIYWRDYDGGTLCLNDDDPYRVRMGVDGRFMPPFSYTSESIYGVQGTVRRGTQLKERSTAYPLMVYGEDPDDVRENINKLLYATNPLRGPGKLKVATNDGKTRLLNCYLDAVTLPENDDTAGWSNGRAFQLLGATFISHDSLWLDPLENDVYVDSSDLSSPFTLYNAGDVEAWPIWSLTGAWTTALVYNETTGKQLYITFGLPSIAVMYVDTRPLINTVNTTHVTNRFSNLSTDSTLFSLAPGFNQIDVALTGTSGTTSIRVRWVNRYLGV